MATKTINTDCELEEENRISHCLTTFSHIVTVILSYLNAQDLNRSARVCCLWSSVAKKLKKLRRTRAWTCLQCDTSSEEESGLMEQAKHFIRNLYTEPKAVFVFYQTPYYETISMTDLYRSEIPPDCKFVGIASGGIIGSSSDLKQTFELETGVAVSILCLPQYDGVDIVLAETEEGWIEEEEISSKTVIDMLAIDRPEQCKAILSFISDPGVTRQVGFDLMKHFPHSLVAGGYVDNIIPTVRDRFSVLKCAALCGSGVQVASVIIKDSVNTAAKAEEAIKRLKGHNLSEANSFAFMFACIGRGSGLYGEANVESSIFMKHFPKTPLFGFFGNGEIGFDFVSGKETIDDLPEKKKKKSSPRVYHSYTTIMVLVSIT